MAHIILYKGDDSALVGTLNEDITGWKVRCELWDDTHSFKLATANSGGSDDQIEITNAAIGEFTIYLTNSITSALADVSNIEVQVETVDGKVYTVSRDTITFQERKINWTTP
ncbi:MAG: hypothetical protein DRP09_13015 [Candidatus Thorarchaeota archaeon]|nr:MAG: hypothetical protein DRP09_13015 [Candidatus Thorarchaeota archaeon]